MSCHLNEAFARLIILLSRKYQLPINLSMINDQCPSHNLFSETNVSDLLIPFRLTLHNNQSAYISKPPSAATI